MVTYRSVRGMNDLFAPDLNLWHKIESSLTQVFGIYGFEEIRTPILEDLALFKRGVGETTDIVEKEMFVVPDGDNTYCLRPENTAPVVRALIERGQINADSLEKLFYIGPMFRKERPQKGRLRQFHQFGVELFGVSEPSADVEIIAMVDQLFSTLGLTNLKLKLNSLGTNEERAKFRFKLQEYLGNQKTNLCEDCQRRFEVNTLRVLDCKNTKCQEIARSAPTTLASLGPESAGHFEQVKAGLSELGISYELNSHLVRGLDYYQRTVFEFVANSGLGAQNTVAGGGRYDGLFLTLGNKTDLPAIGCAGGIERIVLLLEEQINTEDKTKSNLKIALVGADDQGQIAAKNMAFKLRRAGISADYSLVNKSLKAQMRRADKIGAQWLAVIGQQEITNQKIILKNMIDQQKQELNLDAEIISKFLFN